MSNMRRELIKRRDAKVIAKANERRLKAQTAAQNLDLDFDQDLAFLTNRDDQILLPFPIKLSP